jgi:hypothetical protein
MAAQHNGNDPGRNPGSSPISLPQPSAWIDVAGGKAAFLEILLMIILGAMDVGLPARSR